VGFADYRVALVTGASSGIGAATVRRLRAEGLEVHAMARDADRLAALATATGCVPHALDVRATAEIAELAGTLEVDVLVNNAGQSRQGDILSNSADDVDQLIDVNLRAILHLARLFVPGMVARNRGHIVTISSIAGHYAFPGGNTVYHATKAGVHSLSQQLRAGERLQNVGVLFEQGFGVKRWWTNIEKFRLDKCPLEADIFYGLGNRDERVKMSACSPTD